MKVKEYIQTLCSKTLDDANQELLSSYGICNLFSSIDEIQELADFQCVSNHNKDEYGDWQTDLDFALSVCSRLKSRGINPSVIIEPTCGKGNFILAALQTFDSIQDVYGIELYKPYIREAQRRIIESSSSFKKHRNINFHLHHQSVFNFNFDEIAQVHSGREILIIGNPPWVTNSLLSEVASENLPAKSNFKKVKGLEAITGKGNFDISEYISYQLIAAFGAENCHFSFLVKSSVVKNIVFEQRNTRLPIKSISQYNFDANKEFGVSVSACLMDISLGQAGARMCKVFDYYSNEPQNTFGWVGDKYVSDIHRYADLASIDGISQYEWWSGVKHDCGKVMELTKIDGKYYNGFGEVAEVDEDTIYPLVKSSDIKKKTFRKYVILSQRSVSENTEEYLKNYPKTRAYLLRYADKLDGRKSVIYKKRSRFAIFGIGDYSFAKYKVAISGLYKDTFFSLLSPIDDKPVIVDDTCYLIGFDNEKDAKITCDILNSQIVQDFIKTLMFADAKRVINKELLMRIDIREAASLLLSADSNISCSQLREFIMNLHKNALS